MQLEFGVELPQRCFQRQSISRGRALQCLPHLRADDRAQAADDSVLDGCDVPDWLRRALGFLPSGVARPSSGWCYFASRPVVVATSLVIGPTRAPLSSLGIHSDRAGRKMVPGTVARHLGRPTLEAGKS